jgi:hypothetical protein
LLDILASALPEAFPFSLAALGLAAPFAVSRRPPTPSGGLYSLRPLAAVFLPVVLAVSSLVSSSPVALLHSYHAAFLKSVSGVAVKLT